MNFTWIRKKVGTIFLHSVERYIDTQRNNEFLGHKSTGHNCWARQVCASAWRYRCKVVARNKKRQLKQIRLLSASACELKVMKHFPAETVESADTQEGIQGYSVASVDAACDVTSEVTECESGVRLCLYQLGCGAFFF